MGIHGLWEVIEPVTTEVHLLPFALTNRYRGVPPHVLFTISIDAVRCPSSSSFTDESHQQQMWYRAHPQSGQNPALRTFLFCRFITEERSKHIDDDSFWYQFGSEKGERLCYQQILNKISITRIATDTQDAQAADARLFFGGNLEHPTANGASRYTWSGKSYVLTKDCSIAKVWRTLLATQSVTAKQWGVVRFGTCCAA